MRSIVKNIIVACWAFILLIFIGCNSIERRSELPDKKTLAEIERPMPFKAEWSVNVGRGVGDADVKLLLASYKNLLITANNNGEVVGIDKKSGKISWRSQLKIPVSAGPVVGDDIVLLGTSDARIVALDYASGKVIWETSTSSEVLAAPSIVDGVAFVHTLDSGISALNIKDGRQLWRFTLNMPPLMLRRSSSPVVTDKYVIVGFANSKIVAINKIDGSVEWAQDVSTPKGRSELQRMVDISADPLIVGDRIFAVSYQGNLAALTIEDGQLLWERELSSYSGLTNNNKNSLFVSATNGDIWSIEQKSGETMWLQPALQGRRLSKPVVFGQSVVVGDEDGVIHVLSQGEGKFVSRYTVDKKGIEVPPIVENKTMYVLGRGGKVVALCCQQ